MKTLVWKFLFPAVGEFKLPAEFLRFDFTDAGYGYSGLLGDAQHFLMMFGRGDKQELIIFPPLERDLHGVRLVSLGEGTQLGRKRQGLSMDLGAHPAFFAHVSHV